ncbi:MAG: hypothetical protein LV471_07695, partial [Nitrosomonas sp.]|nr:hypothetical protein [Nitrosomonas sp.]
LQTTAGILFEKDSSIENSLKRLSEINPDKLDKALLTGVEAGLKNLNTLYAKSLKLSKQLLG